MQQSNIKRQAKYSREGRTRKIKRRHTIIERRNQSTGNPKQWLENIGNQSRIGQRVNRKNKARTVERMKNALKHLTVFYQNVNKIEGRLTNKKSR